MYYLLTGLGLQSVNNRKSIRRIFHPSAAAESFKQADGRTCKLDNHTRTNDNYNQVGSTAPTFNSQRCMSGLDLRLVLDIIFPNKDLQQPPPVLNVYHLHAANINTNSSSVQILSARLLFCVQTDRVQLCHFHSMPVDILDL